MTDLPEDTWMKRDLVTQDDLTAETAAIAKMHAREMEKVRDQLYHLSKTHTVALMAADIWTNSSILDLGDAADHAKTLYREVQKTLEIDRQITDSIPAA